MTIFLTVEDLLQVAANATGAQPLVRDFGLLESAAARPQTTVFGAEAYPDLWAKAAALGHSLIANHALVDGNKRLGWVAMRTFLELNGVEPVRADVDAAERFVLEIATGDLGDVAEITKRLRALASQ
ncbi:MAG: type II toxin-antitoxin system death-on-curing family toxin [Micromonosporaceae bacterium]|nr:type II toxin-antitoxin system death-on-curing family toxin [Micromonosporaceae bacterium]